MEWGKESKKNSEHGKTTERLPDDHYTTITKLYKYRSEE